MAVIKLVDENTGKEYTLAKYDKKVRDLDAKWADAYNKGKSMDASKAQYAMVYLAMAAYPEYLEERLDGKTFDTIDIVELGLLFHELQYAYAEPFNMQQLALEAKALKTRQAFSANLK